MQSPRRLTEVGRFISNMGDTARGLGVLDAIKRGSRKDSWIPDCFFSLFSGQRDGDSCKRCRWLLVAESRSLRTTETCWHLLYSSSNLTRVIIYNLKSELQVWGCGSVEYLHRLCNALRVSGCTRRPCLKRANLIKPNKKQLKISYRS